MPGPIGFSHMGIHCFDLEPMYDFYTNVMGMTETDRGELERDGKQIVVRFLSSNPSEHHQLVLYNGRTADRDVTFINQISFRYESLDGLRELRDALDDHGLEPARIVDHGASYSVYFDDLEGNRVEAFVDTPWYVEQPMADPLDLSKSDDTILAETKEKISGHPTFKSREKWELETAARMGIRG